METNILRFYPSGHRVTKHPIHKVLEGKQIEILDLRLIPNDSDTLFYLILKSNPDSPEPLEEILLQVSESGCSVPASIIDLTLHELEVLAIPYEPMPDERYCIEIEYKILS